MKLNPDGTKKTKQYTPEGKERALAASRKGGRNSADKPGTGFVETASYWGTINGPLMCSRRLTCPHCDHAGSTPAMFRWHFDRCPYKEAT